MSRLTNRKALITGGSSGIGRALALGFATEGADIAISFKKNAIAALEVVKQIESMGRKAFAFRCDFNDPDALNKLFNDSQNALDGLDILINNVGIAYRTPFLEIKKKQIDEVMMVNFVAPFLLSQCFCSFLIKSKKKGVIVNISSLSSERSVSRLVDYQSSKAALTMLSRSLAYEMAKFGIRANTISPGLTETNANMKQRIESPATWQERVDLIPLGHAGSPNDYVEAAILLASNRSEWMTGTNITIDGGQSVV